MRIRDFLLRDIFRDGQESVEAFADTPRQTLFLGFVLGVARGHVDGEEVGGDDVRRGGLVGEVLVDVAFCFGVVRRFADHEAQLDFVVQVYALGGDLGAGGGEVVGGGGFEEEEGLGGAGGGEFGDVVATWGGRLVDTREWEVRRGRRGNGERTHSCVLCRLPCGSSVLCWLLW